MYAWYAHTALLYMCCLLGFEADLGKFFFYMLTLALLSSTASTLVYAISARVPVVTAGTMFLSVVFIEQLVHSHAHDCVLLCHAQI